MGFNRQLFSQKSFIIDVWKGSKYALDTAQTECAQHRCPRCHMNMLRMFNLGCVSTRVALFDLRA